MLCLDKKCRSDINIIKTKIQKYAPQSPETFLPNFFLYLIILLSECIVIVRVGKHWVVCLSVCLSVCLCVCLCVCVSALVWRNYWADFNKKGTV